MSIDSDIKAIAKKLNDIEKKQLPFATAKALTATVKGAQEAAKKGMVRKLDRPTPFTLRGVAVERATKQSQRARVFIKDIQAEYLDLQITGGTRLPRRRAILVPANVRLNKYGNMPRNKISKLLDKPNVFSAEGGIYQRYKRKQPKLLVSYADKVNYGVKYPFYKIVSGSVKRNIRQNFRDALREAMATAKK